MHRSILFILVLLGHASFAATGNAIDQTASVTRIDGSHFDIVTHRPAGEGSWPLLLFIDERGCHSVASKRSAALFKVPASLEAKVATLAVEKPGVKPGEERQQRCSKEYLERYTVDARVQDHLRALQHLRAQADWWNGELYVHGYADGAAIGVQVAAYYPQTKKAAFGGLGGGISTAEVLTNHTICHDKVVNVAACRKDLAERLADIRANPASLELWGGPDHTYRFWAGRLDNREVVLLRDMTFPILLYHGTDDWDIAPVDAARESVAKLKADARELTYWEIPQMQHALVLLPERRRAEIWAAVNRWLFGEKRGAGGPPKFGLSPSS